MQMPKTRSECSLQFCRVVSNTLQVRAKIVRGEYDMPDVLFQHVSSEAKDFISKLLLVDADKRMSADQALAHPWLRRSSRLAIYLQVLPCKRAATLCDAIPCVLKGHYLLGDEVLLLQVFEYAIPTYVPGTVR